MRHEPESEFRPELSPDEVLLWSGRPRQGIVLRGYDVFFIPISLFWGAFVCVWEVAVIAVGAPWFFALLGVPFVLVGLYLVIGRFWHEAAERARTSYAVTNERVVIVSGLFNRSVKSLAIDTLSDVALVEKRDGSGTISFGPVHPLNFWFGKIGGAGIGGYTAPALDLIENGRAVYEIIRQAQRAARQRS